MVWFNLVFLVSCTFTLNSASHQDSCNRAFGLQSGDIKDDQLSSNSYIAYMYFSGKGTFNTVAKYGRLNGPLAWCAHEGKPGYRDDPYIQVDFGQIVLVSGLAIQGLRAFISSYYVKTYTVTFSLNGSLWFNYNNSSHNKVWQGTTRGNRIKRVFFSKLIRARYLRLHPQSFRYRICLRMEIYGCDILNKAEDGARSSTIPTLQPTTTVAFQTSSLLSTPQQPTTVISTLPPTTPISILQSHSISVSLQPTAGAIIPVLQPSTTLAVQPSSSISTPQSTCNSAFGLEKGDIKDGQLSCNSYVAYMYFPGKGTFNTVAKFGRLNGPLAWCAHEGKSGYREDPYIQVDFGQIVHISGLAIQGLRTFINPYYVKTYTVKFSLNGSLWFNYGSPHNKVWQGSTDGDTINRVLFSKLVRARYLQLHPRSYRYRICLRMEIYGCYLNKTDGGTLMTDTSTPQAGTVFPITMTSPDLASSRISTEAALSSAVLAFNVGSQHKTGSKRILILVVCIALALFAALFTVLVFVVLKKKKTNDHSISEFHVLNPRSHHGKTVEGVSYNNSSGNL